MTSRTSMETEAKSEEHEPVGKNGEDAVRLHGPLGRTR